MATYQANKIAKNRPIPNGNHANEVIAVTGKLDVATGLAVSDTIEFLEVPANHRVVDVILVSDALDSGSAILLDLGWKGGDIDAFLDASTVGQAGGVARADQVAGFQDTGSSSNRTVMATVDTGPTGGQTGVQIECTVLYRPIDPDE